MKIRDILTATASVAGSLNPALGAAIGAINLLLPKEKQLPITATGDDASKAVSCLSDEQQAQLLQHEIDVEIKKIETWRDIQEAHSKADSTGQSTRPRIAYMMAWAVLLAVLPLCWTLAYAITSENDATITAINASWPFIAAAIGTPTLLLRAYFGMRTKEKTARYKAASGQTIDGLQSLTNLIRK
ncbi:hypothetical protein EDC56_3767 [Sinobacterium caligoides]|uniref:Uncharacterized protein n=1 Tax=Sinobacterium caligoides TaxID=933926 RepID=A0A3N2D5I2_9GAMM|nr:hypothetical protein [Sinobacterium caligoides]ROR94952.1 hypothetical protein EDC56_3767 [Sinobacterium caligoides]